MDLESGFKGQEPKYNEQARILVAPKPTTELMCKMISEERIMGFVEGEGCFSITIQRYIDRKPRKGTKRNKIKRPFLFKIIPTFRVTISEQDREILDEIKETLGFGQIYTQKRSLKDPRNKDVTHYYAQGIGECLKTKDFFLRQKFYTNKGKDFQLWCQALQIIKSGKHLEKQGILEICDIRDKMNKRASKGKWSKEEIERILDEKPIHAEAHFTEKQARLIHNNNVDLEAWIKPRQGNHKKPGGKPEAGQSQPEVPEKQAEGQETPNVGQNNSGR